MTGVSRGATVTIVAVAVTLTLLASARAGPTRPDLLLGSGPPGNTFIGAQVPFGFADPGPDTLLPTNSGYRPGQPIVGFGLTHDSGTGGAGTYGNFRVTPGLRGSAGVVAGVDEHAEPGFYSVRLGRGGILVELTAARLAAMERFTYPPTSGAMLSLDAAAVIQTSYPGTEMPRSVWVRITGPDDFAGGGSFVGGWNGAHYRLFFSAQFDRSVHLTAGPSGTTVIATFDTRRHRSVILRLGVSFTSPAMAQRHLAQLPGFDFAAAVRNAQAQWHSALDRVTVAGGTGPERRLFASALYHAHLMPHDVTGDGSWPAREPHYEDFFTLWDTFRTLDPLLELTEPRRVAAMITSLITTYRLTGWLPDAREATSDGVTQVGSSGDILVADALVKGLPGIDYATAYRALQKDADVQSPDVWAFGRTLTDWKALHYVALDDTRSAARTLEYAYDDFAVAEVAQRLGHAAQAARYRARARYWSNLWDGSTQSIRPRYPDGRFESPFDPTQYSFSQVFFEGSPLEWSTFVPQDVQGLINRVGGDEPFVRWLDRIMACCFDPGNEPDLLAPWLYIHAGRPDRTDAVVRALLARAYHVSIGGLPGNDDAGALSAWYVWSAMGLYPNAGQPYYYIGAPLFTRVHIALGGGRSFTIQAPRASASNRYVVGATLNRRPLRRAFLMSSEVEAGGTLVLRMARFPHPWAAGMRPFSLSPPSS